MLVGRELGRELGIIGLDVVIIDEDSFYVSVHIEADLAPGCVKAVSTGEVDAREPVAFPIFFDSSIK